MLTKKELYHLQDLSAINIDKKQEDIFLEKFENVIKYLDLLNEINIEWISNSKKKEKNQIMLDGINDCKDSYKLLSNVNHEIINNCVVIKSVLS